MNRLADQIDAILPQTQCGLCGFKGCRPYANALAAGTAAINLCPPGGVKGLLSLAQLVNQNPDPYLEEMTQKAKPLLRAVIREAECIGCTKCIQACPVDAILGTGKLMHTVLADECTGCQLCVEPCPVDCIDMIQQPEQLNDTKRSLYRQRFNAREKRLQTQSNPIKSPQVSLQTTQTLTDRQDYIKAALQRAREKKLSRN